MPVVVFHELYSTRPSPSMLVAHVSETPLASLAPYHRSGFPTSRRLNNMRPMRPRRIHSANTGSKVRCDENGFQVTLGVQEFTQQELKVKVVDDFVIVEGKHGEKQDEHGLISQQFLRKYAIPKEYAAQHVQSSLSSDGVLSITAPKCDAIKDNERAIPITCTGPFKAVAEQKTDKKVDEQADNN